MQNYPPDNNNNNSPILQSSRFLSPIYNNAHDTSLPEESIASEHIQLSNGLNNEENTLNIPNSIQINSQQSSPLDSTNCQQAHLNYVDHLNENVKLEKQVTDDQSMNSKLNLNENQQNSKIKIEHLDSQIEILPEYY